MIDLTFKEKMSLQKSFLYVRDNELIGVALVDILPESLSSIYCFYDHDFEDLSIWKILYSCTNKNCKRVKYSIYLFRILDKRSLFNGYKESYKLLRF